MSYRDKNRKLITLPSGGTCYIRKLIANDYIAIGDIPSTIQDGDSHKREPTEDEKKKMFERGIATQRVIFTRCISPIRFFDSGTRKTERLTVVDKPFGAAAENEIEIEALDQADAVFIVHEVLSFSDMLRKEAGDSAQTFQQEGQNQHAQNGEAVPCPA